jgi:hypothetical protein
MGVRFACLCPAFTATDILDASGTLYPEDATKTISIIGIQKYVYRLEIEKAQKKACNKITLAGLSSL